MAFRSTRKMEAFISTLSPTIFLIKFRLKKTMLAVVYTLLLSLLFEPGACANSILEYKNCHVCEENYRKSPVKCPTSLEECEGCQSGFVKDTKDPEPTQYHCYKPDIIVHPPETIESAAESEIKIPCEFNHDVACQWLKNEKRIFIRNDEKYEFAGEDAKKNEKTHVCTLLVKGATEEDSGQYRCWCLATDEYAAVKSNVTEIIVYQVVVQPEALISVSYSKPVNLSCRFNLPVRCNWLFKFKESARFTSMTIAKNLAYMDQSGELNENCSIRIKELSPVEEGDWQCLGENQARNLTVRSSISHLTGYKPIATKVFEINIYFNGTKVNGEIVSLSDLQTVGVIRCLSHALAPTSPLTWTINKMRIETGKVGEKSNEIELSAEEILRYFKDEPTDIVLRCQSDDRLERVIIIDRKKDDASSGAWIALSIVFPIAIIFGATLLVKWFKGRKNEADRNRISGETTATNNEISPLQPQQINQNE